MKAQLMDIKQFQITVGQQEKRHVSPQEAIKMIERFGDVETAIQKTLNN